MKHALLKSFTLVTLIAGLTAAQALPTAGPHRPVTVPADFVITPYGYFHPSCVAQLAKGDVMLSDEKVVQHANGTKEKMHVCAYSHYEADGTEVTVDQKGTGKPTIGHSWIEYASATTPSAYGELFAEWVVPPTPTSNDGQTLYFFPGLEDYSDVVTIIQPVLGWNSDYASSWGLASWNCCVSGTTYEASPVPAKPGDNILGYMFNNCGAGTKACSSWDIVTWDLESGQFSELLDTSNFGQIFNWAFGGVLEVYNIAQCSDYPSRSGYYGSNAISFNEIGLYNDKFAQIPSPAWSISNISGGLTPQCSYGGSLPKQVILTY